MKYKVKSQKKFTLKQKSFVAGRMLVFEIENGEGFVEVPDDIDINYLLRNVLKPLHLELVEEEQIVQEKKEEPVVDEVKEPDWGPAKEAVKKAKEEKKEEKPKKKKSTKKKKK